MKYAFSFTMFSTFETCPFQFRAKYIKRDPEPPPSPQVLRGRVEHQEFDDVFSGRKPCVPGSLPAKYVPAMQALQRGRAVMVEQKMAISREGRSAAYTSERAYFRGAADLMLLPVPTMSNPPLFEPPPKLAMNQGNHSGLAYVFDWKTGKPGYEKAFQLAAMGVLARAAHPGHITRVAGRLIYTSHDKYWPPGDGEWYMLDTVALDAAEAEIYRRGDEIDAAVAQDMFVKKRSALCRFCSARDCQFSENKA